MTDEASREDAQDDIRDEIKEADAADKEKDFEDFAEEDTLTPAEEAGLETLLQQAEADETPAETVEEVAAREEAARQDAILKAQAEAEKQAERDAKRKQAARDAINKRLNEGKATKPEENYRHQPVNTRQENPDLSDLQLFPAHIVAHAILAAIPEIGASYDGMHDNSFELQPDGTVRCSLKLKGGGHKRIFVHVPHEVRLAVVPQVKLEEAA